MKAWLIGLCFLAIPIASFAQAPDMSKRTVESTVVNDFDIRTIRSGLNASRSTHQWQFAQLGFVPSYERSGRIVLTSPDWTDVVLILKEGDLNNDGIDDILICFTEKALHGTYTSQSTYLLTRYSKDQHLIALNYAVTDKVCPPIP